MALNSKGRIIRAKIMLGHFTRGKPFFASLLSYMTLIESKECPSMGVDRQANLYYNPEFVSSLTDEELSSALVHETLHLALSSFFRLGLREHNVWNVSSDSIINYILVQNGFTLSKDWIYPQGTEIKFPHLNKGKGYILKDVDKKTAETIYDELYHKFPKLKVVIGRVGKGKGGVDVGKDKDGDYVVTIDEHHYGKGDGTGSGKDGKDKSKDGLDGKSDADMQKEWTKRLIEASILARLQGNCPAGMERIIGQLTNNKVNWRTLLRKYITSECVSDFTWALPSKRSQVLGTYLPRTLKENVEIVACIDTSGCFIGDTLIYTENGIEEIKNINPNEKILNSDFNKGTIEKCNRKFEYKAKELVTIRTKTGKEIKCTPNHQIFVYNSNRKIWNSQRGILNKGNIIEKEAKNLTEGDLLISLRKINFPQNEIILPKIEYKSKHLVTPEQREQILALSKNHSGYEIGKILKGKIGNGKIYNVLKNHQYIKKHPIIPKILTPEFTQLLGGITGDGNISLTKSAKYIAITDKNLENLNKFKQLAERFDISAKIRKRKDGRQKLFLNSSEFALYIKKNFEEIIIRSPKRQIPKSITASNDACITGYVKGIFDAEGSVGDHCIKFDNTSKKLVYQLQLLLLRVGIISNINLHLMPERRIGNNILKETWFYSLVISGQNNIIEFFNKINFTRTDKINKIINIIKNKKKLMNKNGVRFREDFLLEKITKIETEQLTEEISVYDLEIENKHNYFANGVCVHNSIGQEELTTFVSELVGIARSTNNLKMTIFEADAEVYGDGLEVKNGNISKILAMKPKGGGGTSFSPMLKKMINDKKLRNTKLLIYLTDGYGDIHGVKAKDCNFDIIWCLTKESSDDEIKKFGKGKVIKLE